MTRSLKYTLFIAVCTALALIVAMRGGTRDTQNYLEVYRSLDEFPWSPVEFQAQHYMEWGYGLLTALVKLAGLPPEVLFFIVSALTFFAVAKASKAFGLEVWSAMPFYLSTFFLPQQFMQIRQGLAVPLAFWAIALLIRSSRSWLLAGAVALTSALFHIVALLSFVVTLVGLRFTPRQRSSTNWFWTLVIFTFTVAVCRVVSSTDTFELTDRIGVYVNSEEYAATRSVFELANIRAILMTLAFIMFRPRDDSSHFHSYMVLLGLYIVHLGIRIGLIDFAIMSGRLGSSLAFAEIFLLPLIFLDRVRQPLWRFTLVGSYMVLHLTISLLNQLPFLIDDYFSPIYVSNFSARHQWECALFNDPIFRRVLA